MIVEVSVPGTLRRLWLSISGKEKWWMLGTSSRCVLWRMRRVYLSIDSGYNDFRDRTGAVLTRLLVRISGALNNRESRSRTIGSRNPKHVWNRHCRGHTANESDSAQATKDYGQEDEDVIVSVSHRVALWIDREDQRLDEPEDHKRQDGNNQSGSQRIDEVYPSLSDLERNQRNGDIDREEQAECNDSKVEVAVDDQEVRNLVPSQMTRSIFHPHNVYDHCHRDGEDKGDGHEQPIENALPGLRDP